jgi:hypothetical protein
MVWPVAPLTRLGHEDHVAECRQVRAAGDAAAHDGADLRDAQVAAHQRVVVEDARGPILPWKDAALVRQVHARTVDEVDDRDALAHRDLLRAEDLGDGLRPPAAGLDGGVVGHDDHLPTLHHPHARDDAGARRLAVVAVVRHEQPHLEPRRARIEQARDPLARRELALLVHLLHARLAAPLSQACGQFEVVVGGTAQARGMDGGRGGLAGRRSAHARTRLGGKEVMRQAAGR